MRSFTLLTVLLLCTLSWISVSGSEPQTVEVQPGEEVTLLCSNKSVHPAQTDWFRLTDRSKPHCISSMYMSDGEASFCNGIQKGKFQMSSNGTTVFLQIQQVDPSDSGLYFCGFYMDGHTVIVSATHLNVEGDGESDDEVNTKKGPDGTTKLVTVSLVGLTVFLTVVIIVLALKIRKLQAAVNEEAQSDRNENLGSGIVKFLPKTTRSRRPASERGVETHVIYAVSR